MYHDSLAPFPSQGSLFFSNRVENLYERLKENLFPPDTSLFSKRLIIIPSQAMEQWIRLRLAKDSETGIAAGFTTLFLRQAVEKLLGPQQSSNMPSQLALMLRIEKEIKAVLKSQDPLWEPLIRYIKNRERRLISLAQHLTVLFSRYGIYGKCEPDRWEKEPKGWQEALWQRVFSKGDYPLRIFNAPSEGLFSSVHLFCFSHLSPLDFNFFLALAKKVSVYFYQLSPCKEFWSDQPSEKQAALSNDLFLEERHPLLNSLGKVGRKTARLIEESALPTFEDYEEPQGNTRLESLQRDLLVMESSPCAYEDDSIQIHNATTPFREIEILHQLLLNLVKDKKYEPQDIIVMAPDITLYAPFIRAKFRGVLESKIMDMPLETTHLHVEGLLLLLDLESHRWSAPALCRLFKHPLFREIRHWNEDDYDKIREWVQKSGIRWGFNAKHRDDLLAARHCEKGMKEEGATWEEGIGSLLEELASPCDQERIVLTDSELLGDVLASLTKLHADLSTLYTSIPLSMAAWVELLKKLVEEHFAFSEDREALFLRLQALVEAAPQECLYSFQTVELLLRKSLANESSILRENFLQAVGFCSLLPMRAIPAKIICLIGMNQDSFPRKDQLQMLDLLKKNQTGDYYPTRADFDRYLFLEAILSARDKLIITYQGRGPLDQAVLPPSILISELMPYVSANQIITHPARSYDPRYFENHNPSLINFSKRDYQIAKSLEGRERELRPSFFASPKGVPIIHEEIGFHDFMRAFKDPLSHYLKKKYDLSIREEKGLLAEEDFTLTPLKMGAARHRLMRYPLQEMMQKTKSEEGFPLGSFGKLALGKIEQEATLFYSAVKDKKLFCFDLIRDQKKPALDEHGIWKMPAGTPLITGKIEGIFTHGLCVPEKRDWKGAIRALIPFLILSCSTLPEGFLAEEVLFTRTNEIRQSFFEDPKPLLDACVEYYFLSMQMPSPLYPAWIKSILKGDAAALNKEIELTKGYDPLLDQLLGAQTQPEEIIENWQPWAKRLYGEMSDAWL